MIGWTNGCRPGRGKNSRAFFLEGVAGTFASAAADASVSFVADLEDTLEVDEVLHQAVRDPEDLQETARGLQSLRDYGLGDEAVAPYAREGAGKQPRLRVPFFSTGCHQPWIAPPSSGKGPIEFPFVGLLPTNRVCLRCRARGFASHKEDAEHGGSLSFRYCQALNKRQPSNKRRASSLRRTLNHAEL
ncbi:hypothetical protein Drorol1_Dr00028023, partial [Drosera rotundifolia]